MVINEEKKRLFENIVLIAGLIFLIIIQISLLNYRPWEDESETIVTARMMADGGLNLYADIFNHHGPLTFFSGYILEFFGDFSISSHRIVIMIFQWVTLFSIYRSPILGEKNKLLYLFFILFFIVVFSSKVFGHMYKYQVIMGIISVVVLFQYTLPFILTNEKLTKKSVVLGNFLITCMPFLAITYLPIAGLLFLSGLRKKDFKYIVIGVASSLIFNIGFLLLKGSIQGFFAYHIYLNFSILTKYSSGLTIHKMISNVIYYPLKGSFHLFVFQSLLISFFFIARDDKSLLKWRTVLLFGGIFSLILRTTGGFHAIPFYYLVIGVSSFVFVRYIWPSITSLKYIHIIKLAIATICIFFMTKAFDIYSTQHRVPKENEFSHLVKKITNKEDKIIVYSFQNSYYLFSNRLPASGYFFLLPWQVEYQKNPKFGIKIDHCEQIKAESPKIMQVNQWNVWDRFPWNDYGTCVQKIMDESYLKVFNRSYYIRKDIAFDQNVQNALSEMNLTYDITYDQLKNQIEIVYDIDDNIGEDKIKYNNMKERDGSYNLSILGRDPHMVFDLTKENINPKDAPFLLIDIKCDLSENFDAELFYSSDKLRQFNEKNKLRFILKNGKNIIPVSTISGWLLSENLTRIRLDIHNQNSCSQVQINDIGLYRRK